MKAISGKGVLALSVILGLATSYMVYRYMDQAGAAAKPVPMVEVLTAAKNIPPRTVITNDMLRLAQVPVGVKLPEALTTPAQASGKVSKLPITQGEQVLGNKLFGDREESGLAFVVPPGKRAVAVAVNEVVGSGGMIVPGDSVDVVAVLDTKAQADPKAADSGRAQVSALAQYIIQNVEVLAVAQDIEGDPAPQSATEKIAGAANPNTNPLPAKQGAVTQVGARTVTLAVSPEDAEKLVLVEDKGRIRLVLRPHGDETTVRTDDGLLGTLGSSVILKSEPKPL